MIFEAHDSLCQIACFRFFDVTVWSAIVFGASKFAAQGSKSGALIEKVFKFNAIVVHLAFGRPGEQDQQIIAAGGKARNELFIEGLLPEDGRDPFAAWMPSNAATNLLGININNPEMKQLPEPVKGDTGVF